MSTEITEISAEQEKIQIAEIAKASILNIEKNKKAYEELRDEYTGLTLPEYSDPEFKKTAKKIGEGHGKLVKARTAADRLVKQEIEVLDKVKTLIKAAGEELKAITASTEKETNTLKETAKTLEDDYKAEQLRIVEEKKQARIAKLFELGMTFTGAYYKIGELTITPIQIAQFTEAQFEGFVSQATVEYEAVQLKLAEEREAEEKRIADEKEAQEKQRQEHEAAQIRLQQENKEKQALLDTAKAKQKEQDALIASLQAQLKAQEAVKVAEPAIIPSEEIKTAEAPKNGSAIKFTEEQKASIIEDVIAGEVKQDAPQNILAVQLIFTDNEPYIDTPVGKSTLRIYIEAFLDEAQDGLQATDVAATGGIGEELLFMVIKGK